MTLSKSTTFTTENDIMWQVYLFTSFSGVNNSRLNYSIWAVTSKDYKSWWSYGINNAFTVKLTYDDEVYYEVNNQSVNIRTEAGNRQPYSNNDTSGLIEYNSYAMLYSSSFENTGYNDVKIDIGVALRINENGTGNENMEVSSVQTVPPAVTEPPIKPPANPWPKPDKTDAKYTYGNGTEFTLNSTNNNTNTLGLIIGRKTDSINDYDGGKYSNILFDINLENDSGSYNASFTVYGPNTLGISNNAIPLLDNSNRMKFGCIPFFSNIKKAHIKTIPCKNDYSNTNFNNNMGYVETIVDAIYSKRVPEISLSLENKCVYIRNKLADAGYGFLPFKIEKNENGLVTSAILPSIIPVKSGNNQIISGYQYQFGKVQSIDTIKYLPASCYRIACYGSENYETEFYKTDYENSPGKTGREFINLPIRYIVDDYDCGICLLVDGVQVLFTQAISEKNFVVDDLTGNDGEIIVRAKLPLNEYILNYIDKITKNCKLEIALPIYYPYIKAVTHRDSSGKETNNSELEVHWKFDRYVKSEAIWYKLFNKISVCKYNKAYKYYGFFIGIPYKYITIVVNENKKVQLDGYERVQSVYVCKGESFKKVGDYGI